MSVNKVILIGHLGKDPEVRQTPSGATVCTFSLATTERFKNKQGDQQERTDWHNIVTWAKLADLWQTSAQGEAGLYRGADTDPQLR